MVRIYCLSQITKIPANPEENEIMPYNDGADESLPKDFPGSCLFDFNEIPQNFELTEICIGFDYYKDRKIYLMEIFRADIKKIIITMVRGIVRYEQLAEENNALDLFIATSKLEHEEITQNLHIKIRWIKNTTTKGMISREEERMYNEHAKKVNQILEAANSTLLSESALKSLVLIFPNESQSNVLRTKLSDFKTMIELLCDSKNGSYKNVPIYKRYNQKIYCYLEQKSQWFVKKPRKGVIDVQAKHYRDCSVMHWMEADIKNLKLDTFNTEKLDRIVFECVAIFDTENRLYECLKNINFSSISALTLDCCNIVKLTDEFFQMISPTVTSLKLMSNQIIFISTQISKLINLETLDLSQNKNLSNDGFPWEFLPPSIVTLELTGTHLDIIPPEIQRLCKLRTFGVASKVLKFIAWENFSNTVDTLCIVSDVKDEVENGGNEINEINLGDKMEITDLVLNWLKISTFDYTKLPPNLHSLNLDNNNFTCFDCGGPNVFHFSILRLERNCLTSIFWENLPSNLRIICFRFNDVTEIGNVSHLINLCEIHANNNKIREISDTISNLSHLSELKLSNNDLNFLPNGFENLNNLRHLDLSSNKFTYFESNLEETLWKRLPFNLKYLRLSNNNLYKLPCTLNSREIVTLRIENCRIVYICPYFFKTSDSQKCLYIDENPKQINLSFIPQHIYLPSSFYREEEESKNCHASKLKIISDNPKLITTSKFPKKFGKPFYQFIENKDISFHHCKCCGNCGKETDRNAFEQMMVMDFDCQIISYTGKKCDKHDMHSSAVDDFLHPICDTCPDLKKKDYFAGKWNHVLKSRLCTDCVKIVKEKCDTAFEEHKNSEENVKKKKISDGEMSSSHNVTFFMAVINAIDAMTELKKSICENSNSEKMIQNELKYIFEQNIIKVPGAVEQKFNEIENFAVFSNSFSEIIETFDNFSIELVKYSYEILQNCQCGFKRCNKMENVFRLFIGPDSQNSLSLDSILDQWTKSQYFCNFCHSELIVENIFVPTDSQKYLIFEFGSLNSDGNFRPSSCTLSFNNCNINSYFFGGILWELICCIKNVGNEETPKYLTRKKCDCKEEEWINENEKNYAVLIFKKLVIEFLEPNNEDETLSPKNYNYENPSGPYYLPPQQMYQLEPIHTLISQTNYNNVNDFISIPQENSYYPAFNSDERYNMLEQSSFHLHDIQKPQLPQQPYGNISAINYFVQEQNCDDINHDINYLNVSQNCNVPEPSNHP